ncbi:MAG: TetR/AcrR family transcriptional regulator [Candidatus Odinarchaeota archaeon]
MSNFVYTVKLWIYKSLHYVKIYIVCIKMYIQMSSSGNEKSDKKKQKLRDRKKERTRKAILAAAARFFSENPVNEVSVEDIADSAFVSRTTVYNYFKNKDEIFFGLGTQFFTEVNEALDKNFPAGIPGIEQVLLLSKQTLQGSFERPLINTIVYEFFNRINANNLMIEEMHDDIVESIGSPSYDEIMKKFEEPCLIEFYVQLLKFGDLWKRAVMNGKTDGTIKNELEEEQIVHFLFILIDGMIAQMKLRRTTLKRIALNRETVTENSLNLIAAFLRQK